MNDVRMPFEVTFQFSSTRLRAEISGVHDTWEVMLSRWMAIADEARRCSPTQLLVVDRMTGEAMSPEDRQRFIGALIGQGLEGVRIAYVEAHDDRISLAESIEILARERGYAVRVFASETSASVWLTYGED
ncbi:hypothetical protein [Aerolutibacter ruishenii]|uniref:DUF4180 domain-containing protein n=1 Tax=Aerolutibacter ruishenii TaxID=686800 RepID=A0A562LWS1_9GAMM|nr:hypothetical protein [Lysobacter ruishenii]TWI12084.1 hypothetical protein IP93_01365 [Lysobacter ruishenii]